MTSQCRKMLGGVKREIRCEFDDGHQGMCGLFLGGESFRWIDRALSDAELRELSSGLLTPDDVQQQ